MPWPRPPRLLRGFLLVLVCTLVSGRCCCCLTEPRLGFGSNVTLGPFAEDRAEADGNPLRGYFPFQIQEPVSASFPHSLEYGDASFRELSTGLNSFTWTPIDNMLTAAASRGHQLVFRVYMDYPHYGTPDYSDSATSLPQWLLDGGLTTFNYTEQGTGRCPDYTDVTLRQAILNLISAMGARYDGDPRLGFIKVALLGFWGEWHTYPYNGYSGRPNYMAPATLRADVLTAFNTSFPTTRSAVGAAELTPEYTAEAGDLDLTTTNVGWHDDSFGGSTCVDAWGFEARMELSGSGPARFHYQRAPIGGEVRPPLQPTILNTQAAADALENCTLRTKPSWLIYYQLWSGGVDFSDPTQQRERALVIQRQMGYNFVVSHVTFEMAPASACDSYNASARGDACARLVLWVSNTAPAPFYYPAELRARVPAGLAGGADFESAGATGSQGLKGLLVSHGAVAHTTLISWDTGVFSEWLPVSVGVESPHVLPSQTIRLGQNGTIAGRLVLNVTLDPGLVTTGVGTTGMLTTGGSVSPTTGIGGSSLSSAGSTGGISAATTAQSPSTGSAASTISGSASSASPPPVGARDSSSSDISKGGLETGGIVGIVIGAVVCVAALASAAALLVFRRGRRRIGNSSEGSRLDLEHIADRSRDSFTDEAPDGKKPLQNA